MEWDKEAAEKATKDSLERIKAEQEIEKNAKKETVKSEGIWFEDGSDEIKLLDGARYRIYPVNLKKARRLLQLLKTVNVDMAITNFMPSGDDELDVKREEEFIEMISMAFEKHGVDRDYIEENVDVVTATKIAGILLGVNGIKK